MTGTGRDSAYHRFWFDFRASSGQLGLVRLAFFSLLAIDAWLQIAHAPRYGAGNFNVSHLPFLDDLLPMPSRAIVVWACLAISVLAVRAALSRASTFERWTVAGIYGSFYLWSQLDSYQHHYLILCLLVLLALFPRSGQPGERHWPVRLLLVQLSVTYAWAAVAKLDRLWLSGEVLASNIHRPWVESAIEGGLGWTGISPYALVAVLVVLLELFLAVALQWQRLRLPALVVGALFHAGIEAAGYRIGLFSYYMIALYLLLLPPSLADEVWGMCERLSSAVLDRARALAQSPRRKLAATIAGIVTCSALLSTVPIPEARWFALGLGALLFVGRIETSTRSLRPQFPTAPLVAAVLIALLSPTTDVVLDHYRFWGGSSRRLGELDTATRAYRRLTEVRPEYAPGHLGLANLHRRAGDYDDALAAYEDAQSLAPNDHRAFIGEALVHHAVGDSARAIRAAEAALARNPKSRSAREIIEYWSGRLPPGRHEETGKGRPDPEDPR